ncbi:hypothetical protein [Microbulbifer sp. ALW1]|uniref:hypothetical protein n=1 Tax=Microbulbifer sp. (strain ALW1) TaxID=1516059 RepID=UPI00135B250F|nr:hypothetical protein [Microbulbifer sp. ALW1]
MLLPALLQKLRALNASGLLADRLDLDHLALGGHSAGGTVALINGRREWLPGLRATFSYGAHTGAATALGWEADTLLAPAADIPLLIAGGDRDGCIAASSRRYGENNPSHDDCSNRIEQTFSRVVANNNGKNWLCILKQANHFTVCNPFDECTGRGFLDYPVDNPEAARDLLGSLLTKFLSVHLRHENADHLSAMIQRHHAQFATVKNK